MGKFIWLSFGMFLVVITHAERKTKEKKWTEPFVNKSSSDGPISTSRQVVEKDNQRKGKPQKCTDYFKEKKKQLAAGIYQRDPGPEPGLVDMSHANVSFYQDNNTWFAEITWQPPKKNPDALVKYVVIYGSIITDGFYCEELPKNQPFKVVREQKNVWKYPYDFNFFVVALPNSTYQNQTLFMKTAYVYEIPEIPPFPNLPTKRLEKDPKNDSGSKISVIVGSLFGVAILAAIFGIQYKRRKLPHPIDEFQTVQVKETKPQNNDTYFASYLPESEKYSNEVANIAYKLGIMGYKVVFDQVDSVHMNEIGFNMWVDKQILERKKYIIFCTPGYVRLWQSLTTTTLDNRLSHVNKEDLVRVRYEIKRISDVYSENCSTSRIVCIKMDPKMSTKLLPPWMNHNMLLWPAQKDDVIRRLNDQAAMVMHV